MTLLHAPPAVGFEQPYEMLEACHERVERSLNLLQRLAEHLQALSEADAQARDAARDVLRYFDLAAPHHHEDEERHVLPLLRSLGRSDLAELADRIADEHRQMHDAYQALRPGLTALRDHGQVPDARDWPAFAALYRAHIALEEGSVYPAARAVSDGARQAAMGAEMAQRRRSGA